MELEPARDAMAVRVRATRLSATDVGRTRGAWPRAGRAARLRDGFRARLGRRQAGYESGGECAAACRRTASAAALAPPGPAAEGRRDRHENGRCAGERSAREGPRRAPRRERRAAAPAGLA